MAGGKERRATSFAGPDLRHEEAYARAGHPVKHLFDFFWNMSTFFGRRPFNDLAISSSKVQK